ncbi:MAG: DegV family protein [Eubacterium sp.]|nr:DegV family protein [Eubacterium sp.]
MGKVQIITDTCSDLTPELMERYGIDYARMNTVFEGKESPAELSWTKDEIHKFYETIRQGGRFTTTQVPVEEYDRVFRKYLDQGCDIVYVACSTKQSGSVNTAKILAKKLEAEYEGAKIICIDSMRSAFGEGLLAMEASRLAASGKTAEEVASTIEGMRTNALQFCAVHTLEYLHRAGRVKGSAAFFGNLFGVKPILIADAEGNQAAYKKVKGRDASITEIVKLLKESITNPEEQTVYLGHADCKQEEVDTLKERIEKEIPCKDVYVCSIGPIIGASVGPDAISVFAFGKAVTFVGGE